MSFEALSDAGVFCCPVCHGDLVLQGRSLVCPKNHTFDLAKSGYVNLLRSQTKRHGDDKAMLAARRAFLEKGYYEHLRRALADTAARLVKRGVLLDSGCGEGYYTEALAAQETLSVFGVDVSAAAAAYSAKRKGVAGVAVASAYDLPVKEGVCDLVTNVFAPFCREEFLRVLKPGGYLLNVIPAERHLWELKCAIYDEPYENTLSALSVEGFDFLEKIAVSRTVTLPSQDDVAALLSMTPYFYRTDKKGHERAGALEQIRVTASFYLLVYQKQSSSCDRS